MLDWLHGDDPLVADFDGKRVGIAGHSGGGVVVNGYGHEDPRVDAIVSWDRAQSTPLPAEPEPTTPSLFVFADYNCQQVPLCQPEPHTEPPDPTGPGNKGQDFLLVRDAGVDTMQVGLRAALHLDWVPSDLAGNRYAEAVTIYFTRAWMDRYLRGQTDSEVARAAFARLTATAFDDSADIVNISQGFYDPARAAAAGDPPRRQRPLRPRGPRRRRPAVVLLPEQMLPHRARHRRACGIRRHPARGLHRPHRERSDTRSGRRRGRGRAGQPRRPAAARHRRQHTRRRPARRCERGGDTPTPVREIGRASRLTGTASRLSVALPLRSRTASGARCRAQFVLDACSSVNSCHWEIAWPNQLVRNSTARRCSARSPSRHEDGTHGSRGGCSRT